MPHCQQSIGAIIFYGFFYFSTITSQFSVIWNLKITRFLPVQQKACHSKFFHYSAHHSSIQHIFFSITSLTLLQLHTWIKHIWPYIQGVNLNCNTRQQCYKNTGFLQYIFWVTGSQRPPIPMFTMFTLSLNTELCTCELWSSYSLSNPRHHTNNLKFYTCYCLSMTSVTSVYVPKDKSPRNINQGNV
jgi:hypothetical protein